MRASVNFLSRRLCGRVAAFDEPEFDKAKQDFGPEEREGWVVPDGRVQSLSGFKSVYDYLNEELDAAIAARVAYDRAERARVVRAAAVREESDSCDDRASRGACRACDRRGTGTFHGARLHQSAAVVDEVGAKPFAGLVFDVRPWCASQVRLDGSAVEVSEGTQNSG